MKKAGTRAAAVLIAVAAIGMTASASAFADRGGHGEHGRHGWHRGGDRWHGGHFRHYPHSSFSIGLAFGAPFWRAPVTPWYPPPVVVVPARPQVFIERPAPAAQPAPNQYWYYCAGAQAYYPYATECPGGWQRVLPQPPAQ